MQATADLDSPDVPLGRQHKRSAGNALLQEGALTGLQDEQHKQQHGKLFNVRSGQGTRLHPL